LGFVIPGETAAALGGGQPGRVSRPLIVVVAAAVTGPLVGYEIARHLGSRLIAARRMRAVAGGLDRAQVSCAWPGTPRLNKVRAFLSAGADQVR
jgi:membrane-associated protein